MNRLIDHKCSIIPRLYILWVYDIITYLAKSQANTRYYMLQPESRLLRTDTTSTTQNIIELFVDKYLIPATLSVALAQRLVRRLCDVCKEAVVASKEIQELIIKELQSAPSSLQKQLAPYLSNK